MRLALSAFTKFRFNGLVLFCCLVAGADPGACVPALCQQNSSAQSPQSGRIEVQVLDPAGALVSARVQVQHGNQTVASGEAAPGRYLRFQLPPGTYKVVVQKEGFYPAAAETITVVATQTTPVEVHLQPTRIRQEEVEVTAQTSPIDPQQTATTQVLTGEDVVNIPYPSTRDYRNLLRFIPGVVSDDSGQIHLAGGSTQQTQDYLDGFEMSQPAGGSLALRLNPDSLRKIQIETSRYSAQFGKGSAGLAAFETHDGDDRFRFSATDFLPTFQNVKGIHFNNWTPRGSFSGPIVRGRAWFLLSHEGENDEGVVEQLPDGADTSTSWRTADLAKLRVNLDPRNVLSVDGILNFSNTHNSGLNQFNPVNATTEIKSGLSLLGLKDQFTFAKDSVAEFGFGMLHSRSSEEPHGTQPELLVPGIVEGNFYRSTASWSNRVQAFSNVFLRPIEWFGSHQLSFGGSWDRINFYQMVLRRPIIITDSSGAVIRQLLFDDGPASKFGTTEPSAYLQDRWSPARRLFIDAGLRWDADTFIDRRMISPRLAGAYMLSQSSETKLSAGVGVYYDRSNLALFGRSLQGSRTDLYLNPDGTLLHPAVMTAFLADPNQLQMPRFTNWSAGIERRFPARIYGRVDYINRSGVHGWAYESQPGGATSVLHDNKHDNYRALQLTVRKEVKRGYPVVVAYTHSAAHTNEFLDFGQDNPITGSQIPGPLPWDSPNQVTSWGFLPLPSLWKIGKLDLAWSSLWRTGFPFITIDQFQQLVEGPDAHRFPDYFTLNPAIEKKFNFKGYRWAARVGIDNITDRHNATFVDNNVDSPTFLTFSNFGHRTFNGRIRLIGKQ